MADDIKITGPATGDQGGQGNQGKGNVAQPGSVIDLRDLDQSQTAGQTGTGAAPAGGMGAVGATPAKAKKAKASTMLLGEEEEQPLGPQEKYSIPGIVKEKFPDLIQLIKETESMNDEEREYWFQILPIMTEEQIKKFRDILVNEKDQLSRLDKEYEEELQKLNEKHIIEWKEFEAREKRKSLTTAEQTSKAQEKSEEEELLKRLSQI